MHYSPLLFLGSVGWTEILLILVVILLLFGAKKLPEVMGSFGKGVKEFKKGLKDIHRELDGEEKAGEAEDLSFSPPDEEKREKRDKQPDGEGS